MLDSMTHQSLGLGLGQSTKCIQHRKFLARMGDTVPQRDLVPLVFSYLPKRLRDNPAFPVEAMLHIHFTQHWFHPSDPALRSTPHKVPLFRVFAGQGG